MKYNDIKPATNKKMGFDTESREHVSMDMLIDVPVIIDEIFPFHSNEYDCDGLFLSITYPGDAGRYYTTTMSSTILGKLDEEVMNIVNGGEVLEVTFYKRKSYKNKNREVIDFN